MREPMTSPAQRHQQRVLTARASTLTAAGVVLDRGAAQAQALIRAKLDTDRRRLKLVQSVERKIAVKAEVLPAYADYVESVLATGSGAPDDVLGYVMCWRLDAGDFAGALSIARYVLAHRLGLPDRFQRTPATLIAEEPAEQALRAYDAKKPFDVDVLRAVEALTTGHDMPDQVRAKLLFATGRLLKADAPAEALTYLRRAVELHDKVGAKKEIEQLERQLRNASSSKGDP